MSPLRRYLAAAWEASTWRAILYLLIGLPVSVVLFTYVVTVYSVGAALAIVWVGVGVLVLAQSSMRPIGAWERATANALVDARIPAPAPLALPANASAKARFFAPLKDAHAWRVVVWACARIVTGPVGFTAAILALVLPVTLIAGVLRALAHVMGVAVSFASTADPEVAAWADKFAIWVVIGAPLLLLLAPMPAWCVRGIAAAHGALGRWALGMCDREVAEAATARASLAEEQVRIDQELHDSIGHMITMNIVQAGAGAHVFDTDPEFARQALRTIEERGRAAMGELDRIIATIRGDAAERAPLRGLADIPMLIEASRDAGMTVEADVDTSAVPPALGRAAFGIVREALTNAARHAPGSPVTVRVAREDDALGLEIANGPARAPVAPRGDRPRHGVSGMRDRVTLLGGRTAIGPEPGGGFRVRALLPLATDIRTQACGTAWDDLRVEARA